MKAVEIKKTVLEVYAGLESAERMGKMRHFCGEKETYLEYLKQKMQGTPGVILCMDTRPVMNGLQEYGWRIRQLQNRCCIFARISLDFRLRNKEGSWDERYPYASFLNLGGEEGFVADCVWDTRTLGGSFLWPLIDAVRCGKNGESWKVWDSRYNMHRGVGSYMEDSVDLTLYEIKCFYDLMEQHLDWNDEILCEKLTDAGCLLLNYTDHMRICKWLRHFQDFKGYVESFCFRPFVNERYEIVDIAEAKLIWEDGDGYGFALDVPVLTEESVRSYRASRRIRSSQDAEKLRQILTNVRTMTVRRTKQMESLVEAVV